MDGSHPCSLLYDAWVQRGIEKNQAMQAYSETTELLVLCILENGPLPEGKTLPVEPLVQETMKNLEQAADVNPQVENLIICTKTIEQLERKRERLVKQLAGKKLKG